MVTKREQMEAREVIWALIGCPNCLDPDDVRCGEKLLRTLSDYHPYHNKYGRPVKTGYGVLVDWVRSAFWLSSPDRLVPVFSERRGIKPIVCGCKCHD